MPGDPGPALFVYTCEPGSPSQRTLDLLAGWTLTGPPAGFAAALAHPAQFAPGVKWEYSNTNYLLAGLIVERVTGRPVQEEITERVIDKARLRHTALALAVMDAVDTAFCE